MFRAVNGILTVATYPSVARHASKQKVKLAGAGSSSLSKAIETLYVEAVGLTTRIPLRHEEAISECCPECFRSPDSLKLLGSQGSSFQGWEPDVAIVMGNPQQQPAEAQSLSTLRCSIHKRQTLAVSSRTNGEVIL